MSEDELTKLLDEWVWGDKKTIYSFCLIVTGLLVGGVALFNLIASYGVLGATGFQIRYLIIFGSLCCLGLGLQSHPKWKNI